MLEKDGWTEDFAPLIGVIQEAQSDLAVETPAGQMMPNPTLGEVLESRRRR